MCPLLQAQVRRLHRRPLALIATAHIGLSAGEQNLLDGGTWRVAPVQNVGIRRVGASHSAAGSLTGGQTLTFSFAAAMQISLCC